MVKQLGVHHPLLEQKSRIGASTLCISQSAAWCTHCFNQPAGYSVNPDLLAGSCKLRQPVAGLQATGQADWHICTAWHNWLSCQHSKGALQ